jgi:hypothetical protein
MRRIRAIGVVLAVGAALLPAAPSAFPVAANGIGDLYVATTRSIIEVRVDQSRIINAVDVPPVAGALAFSPDGRDLYVSSRREEVSRIDIGSISLVAPLALPRPTAGVAYPQGRLLVVAMPDAGALGIVDPATGKVSASLSTPGSVDLVAADRRVAQVLAAQTGASWLVVADPERGSLKTTKVDGTVSALAVDRKGGVGWVATRSPNALLRVRLSDLKVLATTKLPDAPASVASMAGSVVVAGKHAMWRVTGTTVASFGTPAQAIVSIVATDDGSVLIAAETTMIEAFSKEGASERQIKLDSTQAPLGLAPIPAPSSLAPAGAASPDPAAGGTSAVASAAATAGGSAAEATRGPAATHMPGTATVGDPTRPSGVRLPIEGAIIVAVVILVAYWAAIRPHIARLPD